MSELIRLRPRRVIDLFGQPPAEAAPATSDERTEASADMNALIRLQVRRAVISDDQAAADPKE